MAPIGLAGIVATALVAAKVQNYATAARRVAKAHKLSSMRRAIYEYQRMIEPPINS
jgi:hypothetical protein